MRNVRTIAIKVRIKAAEYVEYSSQLGSARRGRIRGHCSLAIFNSSFLSRSAHPKATETRRTGMWSDTLIRYLWVESMIFLLPIAATLWCFRMKLHSKEQIWRTIRVNRAFWNRLFSEHTNQGTDNLIMGFDREPLRVEAIGNAEESWKIDKRSDEKGQVEVQNKRYCLENDWIGFCRAFFLQKEPENKVDSYGRFQYSLIWIGSCK